METGSFTLRQLSKSSPVIGWKRKLGLGEVGMGTTEEEKEKEDVYIFAFSCICCFLVHMSKVELNLVG